MKIAVVCPGFCKSNINKQPWKYVYEIANYSSQFHEVYIITDSQKHPVDNLKTITVNSIFRPLKGESEELLKILEAQTPDICIMLLGLSSFLRMEFKIKSTVIGIFTSPIYSLRELIHNIGVGYSIKNWKCVDIQYINSLVPNFLVRKWADKFKNIIFLSDYTQKKLVKKGFPEEKTYLIPSGIDQEYLTPPDSKKIASIRKKLNPDNVPIILYFTSPLTLRGTDILVKAFCDLRTKMNAKLVFLSRMDRKIYKSEENVLMDIADKFNCKDSVEIISKNLRPDEIKNYLSAADIICLPFKIVISDIPVSLLESMAIGTPVISTNVGCIPEILQNEDLIVAPNNEEQLSNKILKLLNNKKLIEEYSVRAQENVSRYPEWIEISKQFLEIIQENQ